MADRKLNSIKFPNIDDRYILDSGHVEYDEAGAYNDGSVGKALQNKANTNGTYDSMTVGNAEQLVSNVRVNDKTPYLFRTSGGSVDIGDREYVNGIVGGSLAWNQWLQNPSTATDKGITLTNNGDGSVTINGTNTGSSSALFSFSTNISFASGHKLLLVGSTSMSGWNSFTLYNDAAGAGSAVGNKGYSMFTANGNLGSVNIAVWAGVAVDNVKVYPQLFDLTQLFGSTIADYIYSLETATAGAGVAWFKKLFNKPYYAYNAGELKSVSGLASHDMTGFNQFDKSTATLNKFITAEGTIANDSVCFVSDYIKVVPNATYYCNHISGTANHTNAYCLYDASKNLVGYGSSGVGYENAISITMGDNVHYIRFNGLMTQINATCLNISWDNSRNGEYEPYELHSYPLDSSVVLRGVPKLDANNNLYYDGDTYEADGTVTRRYGIVDLGTLDWADQSSATQKSYYSPVINNIKKPADNVLLSGSVCARYTEVIARGFVNDGGNKSFCISQAGRMNVNDNDYATASAFKTAMSGVYLVYPLATPTTESADPYTNPQIVNDFGTEEYVFDDSAFPVPVGHDTDYPVNLVAKLEMAPNSPSGSGDFIVRQTNGVNEYVPLVIEDALPTIPSATGSYVLTVTVAEGSDPVLAWTTQA